MTGPLTRAEMYFQRVASGRRGLPTGIMTMEGITLQTATRLIMTTSQSRTTVDLVST